MLAKKGDDDYCGSDNRSVTLAVRSHKILELIDDKFYRITCINDYQGIVSLLRHRLHPEKLTSSTEKSARNFEKSTTTKKSSIFSFVEY